MQEDEQSRTNQTTGTNQITLIIQNDKKYVVRKEAADECLKKHQILRPKGQGKGIEEKRLG